MLAIDGEFQVGVPVKLRFTLPALRDDVTCDAIVRWFTQDGVGLQFGSLRARDVWALNQLFRSADAK